LADPQPLRRYPGLVITGHADADLVLAVLDDWRPTAADEHATGFRVFFSTADDRDAAAAGLAVAMPRVTASPIDVDDEQWAERSQASLTAVRVGHLTVAPPWDIPQQAPDGSATIIVLPSMGFGTGHHASTRLCLALLQSVSMTELRVCDVGTGSGVLALAALTLGAVEVLAVDYDQDAVTCAEENAALNGSPQGLDIRRFDLTSDGTLPGSPYDVVIANLTGGLLIRLCDGLVAAARPGGTLILSGITAAECDDVLAAFVSRSCRVQTRLSEDGWEGLALTTSSPTTTTAG
jgi:ribosomal protein L11 methyltransferase